MVNEQYHDEIPTKQSILGTYISRYDGLKIYLKEKYDHAYRNSDGTRVKGTKMPDRTYFSWLEQRSNTDNSIMQGAPEQGYKTIPPKQGKGRINKYWPRRRRRND